MTTLSAQRSRQDYMAPSPACEGVWTIQAVRDLGTVTDVETAAAILGIGRTKAYELAKTDRFPVKTVRVGRRYVVPVPAILRLLGAD